MGIVLVRASRQNKILSLYIRTKSENYGKKFVLVGPTVKSGEKESLHLQNFVLIRRPSFGSFIIYVRGPELVRWRQRGDQNFFAFKGNLAIRNTQPPPSK